LTSQIVGNFYGISKVKATYEEAYQGTRLIYRFNTYQLALQNEEELLKSDNSFAIAILVGKTAFAGNKVKDS
jgi:hypothetical protein